MNIPETLTPLVSIIAQGVARQVFPYPGFDHFKQWPWDGYDPAEGLDYEWPDASTIRFRRKNWRNWSQNDCPLVIKSLVATALGDVDWGAGTPAGTEDSESRVSTLHIAKGTKISKTLRNTVTETHSLLEAVTVGLQLSFQENIGSQYNPADKVSAILTQTVTTSYEKTWGTTTSKTVEDSQSVELPIRKHAVSYTHLTLPTKA